MRPEKTDPGMKKDSLAGSPALTIRAERVMIEAAEQAVREKRDPVSHAAGPGIAGLSRL